jgi:hypothetical protein
MKEPVRRATLALDALFALIVTGCGGAPPSCAGEANPPPVEVRLDATAWVRAHPATTEILICPVGGQCRRVSAAALDRGAVNVGSVPGSVPQGKRVSARLRALTSDRRSNGHVLLRRRAVVKPTIESEPGPCGPTDDVTAMFVLTATGDLGSRLVQIERSGHDATNQPSPAR